MMLIKNRLRSHSLTAFQTKNFVTKFLSFVFILTVLSSCVADSGSSKKKASSASTNNTNSGTTNTTPTFSDAQYWFSTEKVTGTVTVNKNSDNIIYLRGSNIHNFLNAVAQNSTGFNYTKQFCLVFGFASSQYKQVRIKAVPISVTNYETKKIERLFRIDVPSIEESTAVCANAPGESVLPATFSAGVSDVCVNPASTDCRGTISSNSMSLYYNGPKISSASKVQTQRLDISTMKVAINLNSSSSADSSVCTNTSCSAKGFDCCLEGQCVKDGVERPNLSSIDPNEVARARADFATNPLSFINYPQVYFVCTNISRNPIPPTGDNGSSTTEAQQRVANLLPKWKCMNHYDLNFGNSEQYDLCIPLSTEIITSEMKYNKTKIEVAKLCGCSASDDLIAEACPNWKLKPVYKSTVEIDANIVDFACLTPSPESPVGPIVNLNVNVSARAAPHRFFYLNEYKNQTGRKPKTFAYDAKKQDLSDFIYNQEGTAFSYIDEFTKTGPISDSFNMNSVLGSINVDLTKTQPAKMVNVELGRTYILSATSGYFTPCARCAKDSWFESFTAFPNSQKGVGLVAKGYTTKRDSFMGNATLGNYEDTIFGRACWLPATMIPFSHLKMATVDSTSTDPTTQRQNRLKTQAALYINGYQRDWFGFNKGALIGSFDGVQWFAIGTGRRLTATSNKLFLAMNASFLDLADSTDTVVNIIPDLGGNSAPSYDYDPELAFNDPKQNTAATCQRYHQCNTDSDCVTQLGWEYSCADVGQLKTKWPNFNADAEEIGNSESENYLLNILEPNQPGTITKRCVYRGMGSLCKRDFNAITNASLKKAFTCAPNFTCVSLNSSRFNEELIRSPNELDNILYGRDTNILGRPKDYVTSTKALPQEAVNALSANGQISVNATDFGLCMPGKSIASHSLYNHQYTDALRRTDFVNQIGTCNSTPLSGVSETATRNLNSAKYYACPLFGDDMNYVLSTNGAELGTQLNSILTQNSCGGEARKSTGDSAFSSIEFPTLSVSKNIVSPGFAADACFRRAGSVCHTDLDCSPNKLHADLLTSLGISFFGNTRAEYRYWEEDLICGQGASVPAVGATDYLDYDLTKNRCCREVGKDFSMYTSDASGTTAAERGVIIPDLGAENKFLRTDLMSFADPKANYRYSRYSVSPTAVSELSSPTRIPKVSRNTMPTVEQWKVINETGTRNCCGGGWIRKFADGTHDWTVRNRLKLNAENFSCLNYRSYLSKPELGDRNNATYSGAAALNFYSYSREYEHFCRMPQAAPSTDTTLTTDPDGAFGASAFGCLQTPFADLQNGYDIRSPYLYAPNKLSSDDPWSSTTSPKLPNITDRMARVNTTPNPESYDAGQLLQHVSAESPYQPIPFKTNENAEIRQNFLYMLNTSGYKDVIAASYLPFYIPYRANFGSGATSPSRLTNPSGTIDKIYFLVSYRNSSTESEFDNRAVLNITNRELNTADCTSVFNVIKSGTFSIPNLRVAMNAFTTAGMTALADGTSPLNDGYYAAWCVAKEDVTARPVFILVSTLDYDTNISAGTFYDFNYAGHAIDYVPHEGIDADRIHAGNQNYYLTKLGRLELLGIPQIVYEPLFCHNSQRTSTTNPTRPELDTLVPGIFKSTVTSRDHLTNGNYFYSDATGRLRDLYQLGLLDDYGNHQRQFTYQNMVDHPAIFSGSEFACCTPLGKTPGSADKCCSGYAKEGTDGKLTCMLPKGTNLNVYFNKFVSGEGVGSDLPLGGLIAQSSSIENEDFTRVTGELKLRAETYNKVIALGNEFCDGELVKGGAFGYFTAEPFAGGYAGETKFPLSIVDSDVDYEEDDETVGKGVFDQGFRWNHHIYCK